MMIRREFSVPPTLLIAGLLLLLPALNACAPAVRTIGWEACGSPTGRTVASLIVDHHETGTLYAVLRSGEFFASTNLGNTWTHRGRIAPDITVRTAIQHPDTRDQFFAVTSSGLSVSSDGGVGWKAMDIDQSASQPPCLALAFDPWDPLVMVVSTDRGLFRSENGGQTWTMINGSPMLQTLSIHPAQPGLLHGIRSGGGAMVSADGGVSWKELTGQFDASGTTITQMIAHPTMPELLCIGTGGGDLYRSETAGTSWDLSDQGTGFSPVASFALSGRTDETIYATNGKGILVTSDFGGSWRLLDNNAPRVPATILSIPDSSGNLLLVVDEATGVLLSSDQGRNWASVDAGLTEPVKFSFLRGTRNGRTIYAASEGALYRYQADSGWASLSDGLPGSTVHGLSIHGGSDSLLYAATESGPYFSDDAGLHWKPLGKNMAGTPFRMLEAHPSITNRLFGMTPGGMIISTDAGKSWNRTRPSMKDHEIATMNFHHANAGIIAIGTVNNKGLVTRDGGINWDEARYGIDGSEIIETCFGQEGESYFAWGSDGQGYFSQNNGIEWQRLGSVWTGVDHFRMSTDHHQPWSAVAFINRKDLYYTDSGGANWVLLQVDTPPDDMNQIYWNAQTGTLYGAGRTGGIIRLSLSQFIGKAMKQ